MKSQPARNSNEVSLIFVALVSDLLLLAQNIFWMRIEEPQVEKNYLSLNVSLLLSLFHSWLYIHNTPTHLNRNVERKAFFYTLHFDHLAENVIQIENVK